MKHKCLHRASHKLLNNNNNNKEPLHMCTETPWFLSNFINRNKSLKKKLKKNNEKYSNFSFTLEKIHVIWIKMVNFIYLLFPFYSFYLQFFLLPRPMFIPSFLLFPLPFLYLPYFPYLFSLLLFLLPFRLWHTEMYEYVKWWDGGGYNHNFWSKMDF